MKNAALKDELSSNRITSMQVATRNATNNLFAVFRFLGINMPTKNKLMYAVYSGVINGLGVLFLPISFTIGLITSSSDMKINNLFTSLQVGMNVFGCAAKIVIMSAMLKELRKAEVIMDKLDARCVAKEAICKIVKVGNYMVIRFGVIYYICSTFTLLSSIVSGTPPYCIWIPLVNWRNTTTEFVIAAAIEYTLIILASTQAAVTDSYAVVYIGILRHYVQILLLQISKLCSDPTKSKEENTQELVNCIMDHKHITQLFDIMHSVISKTMFVQFLITAAIVGTTLINLMVSDDLSSKIASCSYVLGVALQIYPCCYYAECLIVESEQFGNAIFHSNWIDQDVKYRKMLVLFIQQSQKPAIMSALKIFPINLNNFIGIAKFSFSLYTLLSKMEYGQR